MEGRGPDDEVACLGDWGRLVGIEVCVGWLVGERHFVCLFVELYEGDEEEVEEQRPAEDLGEDKEDGDDEGAVVDDGESEEEDKD